MTGSHPPPQRALDLMARSHPLRSGLSSEMHLRTLPRIATPCRLLQVVTIIGENGASACLAHLAILLGDRGPPPDGARYARLEAGGLELVWERHSEFASYTFLLPGAFADPFDSAAFGHLAPVLAGLPGEIIRATRIALLGAGDPPPAPALLADVFDEGLVVCEVADGKACIWSDFRLKPDGLGRLLIADRGLAGDEPARLVQRLQELGNYRNMALLGLPLAQRLTPDVTRLEQRLAVLSAQMSRPDAEDHPLLDELSYLSAELARLTAETSYRMSATRAYAQIVADRLASLGVRPFADHQTLGDFTDRRLTPAVRTCASFTGRLDDLSQRAAWASSLLRTRIDTALARQNRDLLSSMDHRTRLQLRLQQTVEGLSIVAISYYLVALIGYVVDAMPGVPHALGRAVAVPPVLLGVAILLSRLRRHRD